MVELVDTTDSKSVVVKHTGSSPVGSRRFTYARGMFGGYSALGRALVCGTKGNGFESHYPPIL